MGSPQLHKSKRKARDDAKKAELKVERVGLPSPTKQDGAPQKMFAVKKERKLKNPGIIIIGAFYCKQ
jgi:hypothetical protein